MPCGMLGIICRGSILARGGVDQSRSPLLDYEYMQCKYPADNLNALTPVAFYSQESHYSLPKATQALAVPIHSMELVLRSMQGNAQLVVVTGLR